MKRILLALLMTTPCKATNPGAMDINEFNGDKAVIGTGTNPRLLGQRQVSNSAEFSINIDRRVFPSLVANGLDARTYIPFPDHKFNQITFEHVSFCPYDRPGMLSPLGRHLEISSGVYKKQAWQESLISPPLGLPTQLMRILKPGGIVIFCTPVLLDRGDFSKMCLDLNENSLQAGLQAWKEIYEKVGFEDIMFELKMHEELKGWYMCMTAVKPQPLKRNRTEPALDRQGTRMLIYTSSLPK